jgi:hypothetical protein
LISCCCGAASCIACSRSLACRRRVHTVFYHEAEVCRHAARQGLYTPLGREKPTGLTTS